MKNNAQVLYLSHGGGPLPLLGDPSHQQMVDCLQTIAAKLRKPSAIIVVSAHWEATAPRVTSAAQPALIYDYRGFPEESYNIRYPCFGAPLLAEQIQIVLQQSGIEAVLDAQRGFDHGLFVPLKLMYPQADIPCVQLSLLDSLDATQHLYIGRALQALDADNILLIGSGFSFHNMQAFFVPETDESKADNEAFEAWLIDTCSNPDIDETVRAQQLIDWQQAPAARYCHPREEHLLPLHVCYGFADRRCSDVFELSILNKKSSMYLWT